MSKDRRRIIGFYDFEKRRTFNSRRFVANDYVIVGINHGTSCAVCVVIAFDDVARKEPDIRIGAFSVNADVLFSVNFHERAVFQRARIFIEKKPT